MNLKEAFDYAADLHPAWKGKAGWNPPFCYNRAHALRILGAQKNVKRLTKADLAAMRVKLMGEKGHRGKRSAGGVNRIMSMLNTVLKELADEELIPKYIRLKPLKENNAREEYFDREDLQKMVESARQDFQDNELADAIKFAVFTGCRQGEQLQLEVGDINLNRSVVTFRDTKNGTNHTLDLHPELVEMLTVRCQGEASTSKVFDFRNKDDLYYRFCKVRNHLGYSKKLVWHSWRHTTGTWLSEAGADIFVIAKVLNHKNTSTTQRYAKLTDRARKAAINSL